MKKTILALAAAGLALPAATPALADPPRWAPAHGHRAQHGYQPQYRTTDNGIRYWQGQDGRYYCKRSNGTTGLIVGGAAGALVGRAVDTRGERAIPEGSSSLGNPVSSRNPDPNDAFI